MSNRFVVRLLLRFILTSSLMILGCYDNPSHEAKPAEKIILTSSTTPSENKRKHYAFPYEDYSDPKTWSTPRLQFVWAHPDDDNRPSIWSMRLDGKDMRRVVGPKELENEPGKDYWINFIPRRSPNNQYLAAEISDNREARLKSYIIFDLKTKKKKVYFRGGNNPNYCWTKDSKSLYMLAGDDLWKYGVKNKTFTKKKRFSGVAMFLIDDDSKFLVINRYGFEFYDTEGNLIKKEEIPFVEKLAISKGYRISPDHKYVKVLGKTGRWQAIYETKPPYKMVYQCQYPGHNISSAVFMPGEKKLVGDFYDDQGHSSLDFETEKFTRYTNAERHFFKNLTLINHKKN